MALLAESLVEEWLNRRGFFTIRGIKHGVGEIDLLAIQHQSDGSTLGWHVEVQASFRPIGYIAKLKSDMTGEGKAGRTSARTRTPSEIDICAREWVKLKFSSPHKLKTRNHLWPSVKWEFHLVYAEVREKREIEIFEQEGVKCHPLHDLLADLSKRGDQAFSGSAGGDLAEIVAYYGSKPF